MNIIKIKAVRNLVDFSRYVLDKRRHRGETIIEINNYLRSVDRQLQLIDDYQRSKKDRRGRRPKLLSLILAFKQGVELNELVEEQKRILTGFFEFVSDENDLRLNKEDIKILVSSVSGVIHHGKNNSAHSHNLLNRVIWSRKADRLVNIDLSKKIYHRELMKLSGHRISDQIQQKKNIPLYNYKLEQLEKALIEYRGKSLKLDKYIELALVDMKKGHTQKALKRLKKIKHEQG